jgi:hypothetical protein
MAVWLVQDTSGETCYLNADDPDEAHEKYIKEFPDYAENSVTVYELPLTVADFREVRCWAYGPEC